MNRTQRRRSRPRLLTILVALLLAGGAAVVLSLPLGSTTQDVESMDRSGSAAVVGLTETEEPGDSAPEGCTAAQMVEPDQYESIERSGGPYATWVIVPDTYELMAPAPLYVLSAIGFTGNTDELDRLGPAFEALDGIVVVTAAEGSDDEFATLLDEILHDFCIDRQRIVKSMVPLPGSQVPREPTPPAPESRHATA